MIDRLRQHLFALVGDRHPASSPHGLRNAEHYLIEQFRSIGLEVATHAFDALGATYRNIIATRPAGGQFPLESAPLLIAAYSVAWVAVAGYLFSIWRRMGRVVIVM